MVCYNESKRLIYIHIPKTGGMTIERILIDLYGFKNFTFPGGPYEFLNKKEGQEGFLRYILKHSEEAKRILDLDKFERFTFIREPFSRACSGIRYLSEQRSNKGFDFCSNLMDFYKSCISNPFYYIHFIMKQSTVLEDLNGEINMKYIGKFENFASDLEDILFVKLGFERKDLSKYHIHKTDPSLIDYDKDIVRELSNLLHKEDYDRFEYEMKLIDNTEDCNNF